MVLNYCYANELPFINFWVVIGGQCRCVLCGVDLYGPSYLGVWIGGTPVSQHY